MDRKKFINNSGRLVLLGGLAYLTGSIIYQRKVSASGKYVWQIDPFKCTQCGRCATECVKDLSAVKCVHAYSLCGYCDLCGGYFKPNTHKLNTGLKASFALPVHSTVNSLKSRFSNIPSTKNFVMVAQNA
jgi:electron transport complex protein RnfB